MANVFYESASELATLTNTFTVDGGEADPTTVSLTITTPSQISTTYTWAALEIDRVGLGEFRKDVASPEAGEWRYVWTATGDVTDVVAGTWTVYSTGYSYATLAALKSRVGIDSDDDRDDPELLASCQAASRDLEQFCRRVFWRSPAGTARTFAATSDCVLRLGDFNDLVSVSAVATDIPGAGAFATSWAAADYQLYPLSTAGPEARPYTSLRAVGGLRFPLDWAGYGRADRVRITGVWGWPSVPMTIREAALIHAAWLFKLKDAPLGVAGYGDLGVVRVRANPVVAQMAGPYRRSAVLVA